MTTCHLSTVRAFPRLLTPPEGEIQVGVTVKLCFALDFYYSYTEGGKQIHWINDCVASVYDFFAQRRTSLVVVTHAHCRILHIIVTSGGSEHTAMCRRGGGNENYPQITGEKCHEPGLNR